MNRPVVEPVRDHFSKRSAEIEESTPEEKILETELKLFPLSFKHFGDYGSNWCPRELDDVMLEETYLNLIERRDLYGKTESTKTRAEVREQLESVIQELQRRKLPLPEVH